MEGELNNDALLSQLGGCGYFQVVTIVLVSFARVTCSFSSIFMSFGLYNPGWRCLDKITTNANNSYSHYNNHHYGGIDTTIDVNRRGELFNQTNTQTTIYGDVSDNYTESCVGFNTVSCQNIEFFPEASTIVTEWGLVCDKSWIPSIIITIQTLGAVAGGVFGGYLGDKFGRKKTLYTCLIFQGVFNLLSVASVSWHMFAVIRVLIGASSAVVFSIHTVYAAEFVSPKWRAVIAGLPLWQAGCILFVSVTYVFKNWKYSHVFNGLFSLLCVLPALTLPESLRWLIVREKSEQSLEVVTKIAKMNNVPVAKDTCMTLLENQRNKQKTKKRAKFSFITLFSKGLRLYTLVLGFGFFSGDMLYFATSFGLSALPGDFYVNSLIVFLCELPANVITWFAPNILGRRPTGFLAFLSSSSMLLVLVTIDRLGSPVVKEHGIIVMVILARNFANIGWCTLLTLSNELYPAIARSKSSGWRLFSCNFAIMISPYVIPSDGSDLFVPFIILALFPFVSAFLVLLLPETKGKVMEDDFRAKNSIQIEIAIA